MQKDIKNIIFDLGGVLVGLDGQRCIDAFMKIGGDKIADVIRRHQSESLFFDTEVGNITPAIFCDRIREMSGLDLSNKAILWAWNELLTGIPTQKIIRLLELRKRYNVYLLSNTNDMHWQKCADDFFPFAGHVVADYFDEVFLSYELHQLKPSEAIFKTVLERTGIDTATTLFIDDSAENCASADALGIQAFLNESPDDWLQLPL